MIKLGEILTLDNNKKFVVVCTTNYDNNLYCYLSQIDNPDNSKICLAKEDLLFQVTDESLIEELEKIFVNIFSD